MTDLYRPTGNILLGSELVDMTEEHGKITLYLKKNDKVHELSFDVRNEVASFSTRDEPGFGPSSYARLVIRLNSKRLTYGIVELAGELNKDKS